ncbi:MAG: Riboflavin synthase alpha chain [Candidatus Nomurabacteria bacterium GW2011_GWA2_43_66]|nr:MAG: Riboflavin synthase alpha chain [Parcubacteria group bacterium GW2011_GWC1_42_21]KKS58583.1 MAG: Riboflavin synthase alpha chain [Candidatus Nomurabacteria bacterium GW2011_GWF1_42_40]KKT00743.1 MAG: Riboflavin synthase alpha chain [Candidatus Nomurabacteria bacterium GW2011_GWA1_43_17]KKT07941.1 MAG: Riboflavin synthase alpha chain [Candidatus Nomurabacteria bacterium GW2011_GWB1_43_19]KKT11902.1 MAG: Riboflavin synthase alpha chain [Candidatus Nomurabacteria bacterium GW2011_GWF2_43_2
MSLDIANTLGKVKLGESISVNGVCSTVKKLNKNISFEYMPETLSLTNLSFLKKGDTVNIEPSMRLGDSISGHIVLGHVDGKGEILNIRKEGNSQVFEIKIPAKNFRQFLVYKGAVTVEGVSLTVTRISKNSFFVKIIPHTLKYTNIKHKRKGDFVNLEFDILAKYAHASKKYKD